jgi:serine/threonine-protein kinase
MFKQPEDLVGQPIGRYTVERLIGQGGFAWVFAARRTADQEPVALKVLKPRYAGDKQFESRFRNESEVASELKHANIVRILEVGQDGENTFFAMDLYPDSLDSLLKRSGPLPEATLLRITGDISAALAFAHAAGIVHRDIKLDNIMIKADGTCVLADFGIARAVSGYARSTGVNMTIGTPLYISPEQAQGMDLDGRSDIYALGVTLYKAATGDVPFHATDWYELARMHIEDPPEPPRVRRPDLSKGLEKLILRCLAKHPDDRYATVELLLADLEAVAKQTKEQASAPGTIKMRSLVGIERRERRTWVIPAVAVSLILLVAFLVLVLGRRH